MTSTLQYCNPSTEKLWRRIRAKSFNQTKCKEIIEDKQYTKKKEMRKSVTAWTLLEALEDGEDYIGLATFTKQLINDYIVTEEKTDLKELVATINERRKLIGKYYP